MMTVFQAPLSEKYLCCETSDVRHQNIVELKDVLLEDNEIFLIFEFVDMDLSRFLKLHPTGINGPRGRNFILQIFNVRILKRGIGCMLFFELKL